MNARWMRKWFPPNSTVVPAEPAAYGCDEHLAKLREGFELRSLVYNGQDVMMKVYPPVPAAVAIALSDYEDYGFTEQDLIEFERGIADGK